MTLIISDEAYYRKTSEWVSDCCLMPTQQIFSYFMARTR